LTEKSREMVVNGLRDQDKLDKESNFVVWKARILSILDRHRINGVALRVMVIPVDPIANERYKDAMAKEKFIILNRVKDHVVQHIAEKETTKEMWDTLKTLYQHTSVQRKMLLENKLRSYQMQKGEQIDLFLGWLKEIWDQLTSIGATPNQELMVRTTLNAVSEEWETFVHSILGRASLPNWEEQCAALRQEEIRRLTKTGSSSKGVRSRRKRKRMRLSHLRKSRRRGRRSTSPRSSASIVGNWVTMQTNVQGRRVKERFLTQGSVSESRERSGGE